MLPASLRNTLLRLSSQPLQRRTFHYASRLNMPGLTSASTRGTVRYNVLDLSVRPEDRGLFSGPAHKYSEDIEVDLFDPASSPEIVQGPQGLDAQGFTYVKHRSALDVDEWMHAENPEEIYVKEIEDLVGKVTGAKTVIVNHLGIRKRLAEKNADPSFYRKAGDKHDETVKERAKKEKAWGRCRIRLAVGMTLTDLVTGKTDAGLEPARFAHVDYTLEGLKRTARYCRKDIKAAAQEALDAEDANKDAKRYAAYSVWVSMLPSALANGADIPLQRPLKPVKRDPLAVADWRTTDKDTLQAIEYRATSNVVDKGEYMLEQYTQTPEAKNTGQKWYCMTKQTPEDVLILKFADTASEKDPSISQHCAHCSPMLPNVENEEPRMSVEARVIAFW